MRNLIYAIFLVAGCGISFAQEPADTTALYGDLDELVVTVKKEIVKSDGSQITYDLENDVTSKGQTLLDALRKVPMVTVDGEDNIYIKGDQNFRVYVNGKEDPMLTSNYKYVFKSMPAESVSKIEVITEPDAKYDAEGVGGILNLVTERKQRNEGYTGSVSLEAGAQQEVASLYGRVKYKNVTADANVNYANNLLSGQEQKNRMDMYNLLDDTNYDQRTEMSQYFLSHYLGATLNLSWEPSDRDLFTCGMNTFWIDAFTRNFDTKNSMFDRGGNLIWQTYQRGDGKIGRLAATGNVSYRRLFDDKNQSLTASYRFNFGNNKIDLDYDNEVLEGSYAILPFEKNLNNNYQREHTATLDYVLPLNDGKHNIEAGAKGIFRRNSAFTGHWTWQDAEHATDLGSYAKGINQVQDVYALYANYKGTYGNVALNGGVRYEHTYMGLDFVENPEYNFRRHLNDVTPNLAVTYMFGPANNLRLAYQMRISRPSAEQMNPAAMQITQNVSSVGNPDLESERNNKISITYNNFTPKLGGSVSISYSRTDNAIEEFSEYRDNILYQTSGNFGCWQHTDLAGFLTWNINTRMSMQVNGSVCYTDIYAPHQNLRNSGWTGSYNVNYSYTGPADIKFSAYGGQMVGNISLQGNFSGWYWYGLAISKAFLKNDALRLTLNANNFLTKYTHFTSKTYADGFMMENHGSNRSWNVGLSIQWTFGQLKDQVKKTDANLDNDDVKSSNSEGKTGIL